MARCVLPVSLLLLSLGLFAQDQHFVYIQTENNQPFYIRMNGKVFSSTAEGYIILPKLASGNYQLFTGFPKNEFPEQEFHVTISGINEGFLLKKLGTSWSLFNIETMTLTEGVNTIPPQPEQKTTPITIDDDPFATLLAGAVRDSSILENDVVTKLPEKTIDTLQTTSIQSPDTVLANAGTQPGATTGEVAIPGEIPPVNHNDSTGSTVVSSAADMTVSPVSSPLKENTHTVTRILLVNEKGGLELMYVDHTLKDTVRIFLPVSPGNTPQKQTAKVIYNPPAHDTAALTITPTTVPDHEISEKKKNDTPGEKKPEALDQIIYQPRQEDTPAIVENKPTAKTKDPDTKKENAPRVIYHSDVNSDCHDFATNKDFLKLRKRMAAETDNDKMIEVAKKYFKNKCFSTEQLRNLSYLFLNDEGRYKFFDAAYPFTSDSDQYNSLESQLADPYYINRFRAMIHK